MADDTQADIDANQQSNHASADAQTAIATRQLSKSTAMAALLATCSTSGQAKDQQIATLTKQVATLEAQNAVLQAALDAIRPKYDVTVSPGDGTPLQTGFNAVPANGTIFINDGKYTENPTIPHACQIITGSTNGVIIDLGGKPFTFSPPSGTITKGGLTVQNAVFGKSGQPAVLITDNTTIDTLFVRMSDSVGAIIRGNGTTTGGGTGIKIGTLNTSNCGEMGMGASKTRNCEIDNWTVDNCCSPTSFNPTKWAVSPGNQGGAGKMAYNDGMNIKSTTVTNTPFNGPWWDTGNTNCVMGTVNITGSGSASSAGGYSCLMIEQNDGTNSVLGSKGVNGATVTVNGGSVDSAGNIAVMIAESSGVNINTLEYHKQIGFRQMSSRPSKIHDVNVLKCISYSSTFPDPSYTKNNADIAAQRIMFDGTTFHGLPRNIGYWNGVTQTTLAAIQSVDGFEKNAKVVA